MSEWDQWNALYELFNCYVFMQIWETEYFGETDPKDQEGFRYLVETKQLYGYVEDAKRAVLRAGVDVPDRWLWPIGSSVHKGPLPSNLRDELQNIATEILMRLPRVHPDSQPIEMCGPFRASELPKKLSVSKATVYRMKDKNPSDFKEVANGWLVNKKLVSEKSHFVP